MTSPYLTVSILYLLVAVLAAADAALTNFTFLPFFAGLRWLRVHFITLGVLTQALFGLLPALTARRYKIAKPTFRWSTWGFLNTGLPVLMIGIPLLNVYLILAGGALVFIAAILLVLELRGLKPANPSDAGAAPSGKPFYITGLLYLLVGITIGTGIWLGWSNVLGIKNAVETHIHANNWGLMSLVFAGLLVDLYPRFTGKAFGTSRSVRAIYWLMTLGALGLVLGPWTGKAFFTVPGLLMHLTGTIWLIRNMIAPIWSERREWAPGTWHLMLSYIWILAPIAMAPAVLLKLPGIPGARIETNAPQALIYGWALQFGYAVLPMLFRSVLGREDNRTLGGTWTSLLLVNFGAVLLWAGIFIEPAAGILHGTAYVFWALSALPILKEIVGAFGEPAGETAAV